MERVRRSAFITSLLLHATFVILMLYLGPLMPCANARLTARLAFLPAQDLTEIEELREKPEEMLEETIPEQELTSVPDEPVLDYPGEEPKENEIEELPLEEPELREVPAEFWLMQVLPRKPDPLIVPAEPEPLEKEKAPSRVGSTVLQPIKGENPPPLYPKRAVELDLEGKVVLEVAVTEHGSVNAVRILKSSGSKLLDQAAVNGVRTWRFENGPGTAQVQIVFSLQNR